MGWHTDTVTHQLQLIVREFTSGTHRSVQITNQTNKDKQKKTKHWLLTFGASQGISRFTSILGTIHLRNSRPGARVQIRRSTLQSAQPSFSGVKESKHEGHQQDSNHKNWHWILSEWTKFVKSFIDWLYISHCIEVFSWRWGGHGQAQHTGVSVCGRLPQDKESDVGFPVLDMTLGNDSLPVNIGQIQSPEKSRNRSAHVLLSKSECPLISVWIQGSVSVPFVSSTKCHLASSFLNHQRGLPCSHA